MNSEHETPMSFFRFEDLRVYYKSLAYIAWLHRTLAIHTSEDKGLLISQFCTAAQNIAQSIAEGSSRNKSQFIYYLKIGKSSIRDCVVFTAIAKELNYLQAADVEYSKNQLIELTKMIGALIGSLQKSGDKSGDDY